MSEKDYVKRTQNRDTMLENSGTMESFDSLSYRMFGNVFNDREDFLEDYQKKLKAAHIAIGADLYLAKAILITILTFFVTFSIGALMAFAGLTVGVFEIITNSAFAKYALAASIVLFFSMFGVIIGLGYYLYPSYRASRRSSAIDATLPSAVTFMYALNKGGMSVVEVMRIISETEEVYGEVSREFGTVIQDIEYFSQDLMSAIRRAGQRSPSDKFNGFMEDFLGVLDSGGQITPFLDDKTEQLLTEAERDQKSFIETLSILAEVYVTAFVAGPLFMIIITVIMSMLGGANPTQLDAIVYGLLPVMNIAFFFLIDFLSGVGEQTSRKIPYASSSSEYTLEDLANREDKDARIDKVYKAKKRRQRTKLIRQPITELLLNPNKTLLFTAPISIIYLIFAISTGLVTPSFSQFIEETVIQTFFWLLVPLFVVTLPLSIFFEIRARRESKMMTRFPDALGQLASANSVGMTLTESLETTAENTTGRLGDQLKEVKNDVQWNHDINEALIKFANRVQIPLVTRTIKLVTEANESSGDLEDVLDVASNNVETQMRLRKQRRQEMTMYTAVILISFAVYLFVIALLDVQFLTQIGEIGGEGGFDGGPSSGGGGGGGGGFNISSLPVERFRLVFYHSTIVQSFGSGMIAGFLATEDVRSGLKFAIILSTLATLVFGWVNGVWIF